MKNKTKLLKLFLLLAIALALPAVHTAPSFTAHASVTVSDSDDGSGGPDDKGGNTTKDGGKGGGPGSGGILTTILEGLRSLLSGGFNGTPPNNA